MNAPVAHRCARRIVLAAFAAASLTALPAGAGPVWLTQGSAQGQGFVFSLGRSCYAYTAGHILAAGRDAPVALIDREGFRAEGRVIKVDSRLDLGLIELPLGADRRLCTSAAGSPMLDLDQGLDKVLAARPETWLDRIASPAGGLDRFELALSGRGNHDFLELVATEARHETSRKRSPQKGDSGASVWLGNRGTEVRRYNKDGLPALRVRGSLLGVLVSVKGEVSQVVRSDRVHEFVFNALQPVDWNRIVVEPRHATVVAHRRGPFSRAPGDFNLPLTEAMLDHVSFELDLGDRDTLVQGVSVEVGMQPAARPGVRSWQVKVHTSQYRPGDGAKWQAEACAPAPRNVSASDRPACTLRVPRVSRGVRVEMVGDPTTLRRVVLQVGD